MAKQYVCNNVDSVVETSKGKIRGFILDGTYTFWGIKYADAKRFQMPTEVEPWEGIKDALAYGYVAPLMNQPQPSNEQAVPHRYWPQDENCQYLNIWTQSICKEAKKPVLVWFHGGGFAAGSPIEQAAYDGTNMSREGDVVVVGVGHRLNILGFLDLSPFGVKYANSGNAGTADMVAALQWVHDNIANFGGDPDNVTIFGQSGGGAKVTTLLQCPAADGLFHKGVIQSGVMSAARRNEVAEKTNDGTQIVNALLQELGYDEGDAEKLETVPYQQLVDAYKKVSGAVAKDGGYIGGNPKPGDYYVGNPVTVGFRDHAKTIPLMVGSVFAELAFRDTITRKAALSEAEQVEALRERFGEKTEEMVEVFRSTYPNKPVINMGVADSWCRKATCEYVLARAENPESPVWNYMFTFDFPFEDGKPAWHCAEIPFIFHNAEQTPVCNVPGVSDKLEEQVFGAWMSFAKYGDPNHSTIPNWPASQPGDVATMIFDRECELKHNYDQELVAMIEQYGPKVIPGRSKIEH